MQPSKRKSKKYNYFIGIDVSRDKLDYAVLNGKDLLFHEERKNEPSDIAGFIKKLEDLKGFKLKKTVFCMEQTGIYCNHLLKALKKSNAYVVVENPLQIKKSLGIIRDKYDLIDSIRIAQYAQKNIGELKLWEPKREIILHLMHLTTVRERLLGISMILKNPIKEQSKFIASELHRQSILSCTESMNGVKKDLTEVDLNINVMIKNDGRLERLKQLITSVPSIGPITALQIILCTNEFMDIKDPKKFACYSGVAPFKRESGKFKSKSKVSFYANKKMKALLHLCALTAIRIDDELKTFYERKTMTEGKAKMSVLNAIRFKLILRIFACVNQDRLFQKEYVRNGNFTENRATSVPPV